MKCRNCEMELTRDKKRNCWVCLECNPPTEVRPEEEKDRSTYIDVPLTPEQERRIRKIVRDELENWHIRKPPVTKHEAIEITGMSPDTIIATVSPVLTEKPEPFLKTEDASLNWRQRAKELGISLSQPTGGARKKIDVLKDIEDKLGEQDGGSSNI